MYTLNLPSHVIVGKDARIQINEIIEKNGIKHMLLLSDKGVFGTGRVTEIQNMVSSIDCVLISDVPTEPERAQVRAIYDKAMEHSVELIVAVGGGSVMDTAKFVSAMITNKPFADDGLDASLIKNDPLPTVMIPTTAGTGSEATQNAIVLVAEKNLKVGVVSEKFIPKYVILDPVLTLTVPKKITAATGIDALCHAVETLISKKTNPICETFSLKAIKLIFENLEKCFANPDDVEARQCMLLAAFYGGVCINTSSTCGVHALSYPLGGTYHIAHGVSNAMLAAAVLSFNEDSCIEKYNLIADALSIDSTWSAKKRADEVVARICELIKKVEIPTKLTDFGVSKDDIDFLVDSAYDVKRLLNQNPKTLEKSDIKKIYQTLF